MSLTAGTSPIAVSDAPTEVERAKPEVQHLGYLDGLRASAAIFVILSHIFDSSRSYTPALPHHVSKMLMIFAFGHYSVDLFIVLSGFCLMLPVLRNGIALRGGTMLFFRKRARRILPPYFAALVLSVVLILTVLGHKTGTNWDGSLPITRTGLLSHIFLVQDLFPSTAWKLNYALWSISVEWRIYFLFPLLILCWRKWGGIITASSALVASLLLLIAMTLFSRQLTESGHTGLDLTPSGANPQFIGLFSLGMLGAGICFDKGASLSKLQRLPWHFIAPALFVAVAVLSKVKILHHAALPLTWTDYVVGLFAASFIVMINRNPQGLAHRIFNWPPLVFMGTFSYSIYLVHLPLLQLYWLYIRSLIPAGPVSLYIITCTGGTALIIAVAYLFFLAFERPFLNTRPTPK